MRQDSLVALVLLPSVVVASPTAAQAPAGDSWKVTVAALSDGRNRYFQDSHILNPKQYPEIADDTLNFVVPFHSANEKEEILQKMEMVLSVKKFKVFDLKHPLNGWFVVFQTTL